MLDKAKNKEFKKDHRDTIHQRIPVHNKGKHQGNDIKHYIKGTQSIFKSNKSQDQKQHHHVFTKLTYFGFFDTGMVNEPRMGHPLVSWRRDMYGGFKKEKHVDQIDPFDRSTYKENIHLFYISYFL